MAQETYRTIEQLVWSGNWRALREQQIAPHYTWLNACQVDAIRFGGDTDAAFPRNAFAPNFGVAVVMMVKDEVDILPQNLGWLYRCGVRRYVVMDNASTDGTWRCIEIFRSEHPDAEVMSIYDPIVRHIQAEKTTGMLRMACAWWPDVQWVVPADADEFLIPMHGFAPLEDVGAEVDAIVIQKSIHFRRPGGRTTANMRAIEEMPVRSELFVVPPKVIVRADPLLSISQGNHDVSRSDRESHFVGGLGLGLYYREFPNRSFEHLLRKVTNGARAIRAAHRELGRSVGGEHWLAMSEVLENEGEFGLFQLYARDFLKEEGNGFRLDPFVPG